MSHDSITLVNCECPHCEHSYTVVVSTDDYARWKQRKLLVQDAFPYLTAAEREQLITGICPPCWEDLWGAWEQDDEPAEPAP